MRVNERVHAPPRGPCIITRRRSTSVPTYGGGRGGGGGGLHNPGLSALRDII